MEKREILYGDHKDKRERSFLIMCDENKMVSYRDFFDFLSYKLNRKKVLKKAMRRFFETMKPNHNDQISYSRFVHAVESDGDVLAAFRRFRKGEKEKAMVLPVTKGKSTLKTPKAGKHARRSANTSPLEISSMYK